MKLLNKFPLIFIVILFLFNYACTEIDDDLGLDDIIKSYSDITASRIKRRSMNINWLKISDKVREMEHLQYKVVRSLEPNIDTVDNALANGLLEMNWTTNTNTVSITNLEIDTIYYFNVLVRDDIGRIAIYNMKKARTLDPNTPLPGNDGTMSISNISTNFITISWIEAQDENFTQADLNYRIYYSTANNIDTIENIELNGTPVGNFSNNVISLSATGLAEGSIYYFNVIVSNNNGYKAPYNTISERTADSNPPVPGNSGNFMLMKVLNNSMEVVWTKAIDTYTDETNIEYKVVYSTSDNISTVNTAEANGTIITDWTKDIDTASISGLGISTTYYLNVLVRDHWGNKAVYTSKSRQTADANNNYLYNPSFESGFSGWGLDWTPSTSNKFIGTIQHIHTGSYGVYMYTGSTTAASFNKQPATAVPWNPGEAAQAWLWFRPAETSMPEGYAIIRVTFRNQGGSTLATYTVQMNDASEPPTTPEWHTTPLYLETPAAPANTVDAVYQISLEKDITVASVQLTISFDDAHLGVLIPFVPEANSAPFIANSPVIEEYLLSGVAFTYDVDATDPDGDTITYSLLTNPSGMTINSINGHLSWTPSTDQEGSTNNVTIKVSDPDGKYTTQSFELKVIPGQAPWRRIENGTYSEWGAWKVMGFYFTPQKDGKITHVAGGWNDYSERIYIYDTVTTSQLITSPPYITPGGKWTYSNITPVSVVSNRRYALMVYYRGGTYSGVTNIPATIGDIVIDGGALRFGDPACPINTPDTNSIYGCIDMVFVPDE